MSTTMLSGNKDQKNPLNKNTNGTAGTGPVTLPGGVNVGGNAGTGPVTLPGGVNVGGNAGTGSGTESGVDLSYGANAGVGGTTPTGGEPVATDGSLSYSANAGTGTTPATAPTTPKVTLSPEQAAYDADGDGVLTYEEYESFKRGITQQFWTDYQRSEQNRLQVQKDATYREAAEAKRRAEEAAERAHERAVVDAQVAGEQNKASYGANAERVAEMGVVGGGYSDYLNAQSYATKRAEIAGAGAQKTAAFRLAADNETDARLAADLSYGNNMAQVEQAAAKGKLDADLTYAGNMQTHELQEREKAEEGAKQTVLSGIEVGTYATKEAAVQAARDAGITDENVLAQIGNAWTSWSTNKAKEENGESYNALLSRVELGEFETSEAFEAALAASGITDENLKTVLRATYKAYENGVTDQKQAEACGMISAEIEAGAYATKEALEAALEAAGITDETAKRLAIAEWTAWNTNKAKVDNSESYNALLSRVELGEFETSEAFEAALAASGITDENLKTVLRATYKAYENGVTDQKQAEACGMISAEIEAGAYATKEALEAALEAAGITDETAKRLAIAEWTAWNTAYKNSDAAMTAFYGNIELGDYATLAEAMEAAKAAGITDANILASIDNKWTLWAVSSFAAAIGRGDYTTKEAALEAARAAGITSASVLGEIGDAWDAWDESKQDKVKTDAYNTIASNIENGVYATVEDALGAAAENGITDEKVLEQIKAGWNAWNKEYTQTYNGNYAIVEEMAKSGNYTADEIRSWCEKLGIDNEDDIKALIGSVQKNSMDYSAYIESGELTTDHIEDIEKGVVSKDISEKDAEKWREEWVDGMMNTEDPFLDASGARLSKEDATKRLDNTINNAWCTPELKDKLQKQFDSIYKVTPVSITCDGTLPEKEGRNFMINYGLYAFPVQNGGRAEGNVVYAAEDVADGMFFVYGEEIYFKQGGTVYIIEDRTWDSGGYSGLKETIKEGKSAYEKVEGTPVTPNPTGGGVPFVTTVPPQTFDDDMIAALTGPAKPK